MNILYYIAYYIYLIILKSNILLNTLINKVLSIKIIIIYIENLFLRSRIVRNINYKTTT